MHKFSDDDMQMLYQLVHAESGNQDLTAQEAVASVVINRVMSEYFPNSVSSVIFADGQFSVVDNGSIWCTPSERSIQAVNNVCANGVTIKKTISISFVTIIIIMDIPMKCNLVYYILAAMVIDICTKP